jgi:hypothetical protein
VFNTSVDLDVTIKPYFLNTYDKCRHIRIFKYIQFMIIYNSQVTIFYYKSQDPSENIMFKSINHIFCWFDKVYVLQLLLISQYWQQWKVQFIFISCSTTRQWPGQCGIRISAEARDLSLAPKCPDWMVGPLSLLFSQYWRLFLRSKMVGVWAL